VNELTLWQMTDEYRQAFAVLSDLQDSGEIDAQTVADTLDAIREPLERKALCVAAYARSLELQEGALAAEIDRLTHWRKQAQARRQRLLEYLKDSMESVGISKIESIPGAPPFRVAIRRNPPKVVIDAETQVPWEFWRERVSRDIDKQLVKDALKAGTEVPGAHMESTTRVDIL